MKLAHQFPWVAGAYVAVGLALRRRELSHPDVPSSALKRKQITKVTYGFTAHVSTSWKGPFVWYASRISHVHTGPQGGPCSIQELDFLNGAASSGGQGLWDLKEFSADEVGGTN